VSGNKINIIQLEFNRKQVTRRSTKFRTKPLEFWKGERMVHGRERGKKDLKE